MRLSRLYIRFPLPRTRSLGLAVLALVLGCGALPALGAPCDDVPDTPGVQALCGVTAPEDIVALDERFLVASSMDEGRQLFLIDGEQVTLEPMVTRLQSPAPEQRWGDPNCLLPDTLLTHGLSLGRHPRGTPMLLAVNHGGRESVEFFAVTRSVQGTPELVWRGCVMAAANTQFNDIAVLPDGGFLATDPVTASWKLPRTLLGTLGLATGRVHRWRPSGGYETVRYTRGAYPNGILLAPDGRSFFLNIYLSGEVRQHDLESGEILGRVAIEKPDNSSWSPTGELLVASHHASALAMLKAVSSEADKRNRIPFSVVAIDPATFAVRTVYESDGGDIGGGTVAEPLGEALYIGAFKGDRVLRLTPPAHTLRP